jgi:hypothetical protein
MEKECRECRNCVNFRQDFDVELVLFYCNQGYFGKEETEDYDTKLAETCADYHPKQQKE